MPDCFGIYTAWNYLTDNHNRYLYLSKNAMAPDDLAFGAIAFLSATSHQSRRTTTPLTGFISPMMRMVSCT